MAGGERVGLAAYTANAVDGELTARLYTSAIATGESDVWQLIDDQLYSVNTLAALFTAIPQTYKTLAIVWQARSTYASVNQQIYMELNGDLTANYYFRGWDPNFNEAGLGYAAGLIGRVPGSTANANVPGNGIIYLPNYAETTLFKTWWANLGYMWDETDATSIRPTINTGMWKSTAAITQINLRSRANQYWTPGSRFTLYGIK